MVITQIFALATARKGGGGGEGWIDHSASFSQFLLPFGTPPVTLAAVSGLGVGKMKGKE
jgi:hypothetical protein